MFADFEGVEATGKESLKTLIFFLTLGNFKEKTNISSFHVGCMLQSATENSFKSFVKKLHFYPVF